MKKIISIIFISIMLLMLCSCASREKKTDMLQNTYGENRFVEISVLYRTDGCDTIYIDKETGVEYWYHVNASGRNGGLTPILNEDGKPIIYQGEY